MSEKRFLLDKLEKGNAILSVKITDTVKDVDYFIMTKEFYEDEIDDIVDLLNEQQAEIERLKELERKIDRQESVINIILNNLPIHQAADIQKFVAESLKEWDS